LPCAFGACDETSQCSASANAAGSTNYGGAASFTIDTTQKYTVKTAFLKKQDDLHCIRTTLTQGANELVLDQDCALYLDPLTFKLQQMMALGVSTYHVGLADAASLSGQQCQSECSEVDTKTVISNVRWTQDDAFADESADDTDGGEGGTGVVVVGGPAPALDSGACANDVDGVSCSECREHYLDTAPSDVWYECVDRTVYRFGNKCGNNADKDKCMTDASTYCHKSYPFGDADKYRSDQMACRTVPKEYIDGPFEYHRRKSRSSRCGLCKYGCGSDAKCYRSWLESDADDWRGPSAMCRCKPN